MTGSLERRLAALEAFGAVDAPVCAVRTGVARGKPGVSFGETVEPLLADGVDAAVERLCARLGWRPPVVMLE